LKLCNNQLIKLNNKKKYKLPKISIISPVYNRGKYLFRFIKSLQNQNFNEIEIILIDDCSIDNTKTLIKKYKEVDKRIILIQNNKNKGTFASRNIGILKSKGEYLMFPDPDDILEQGCLKYFYNLAKKNDYELIRFNLYIGNRRIYSENHIKHLKSKPIYQPQLSTYLFYSLNILRQTDYNVSNKFIKREALIKALNYFCSDIFLFMTFFEDGVLNYFLYKVSKSFYLKKKIGYYYIKNKDSITSKKADILNVKFTFYYLKYVFEYSKNTKYEKDMSNVLFRRIGKWRKIKERVINIKNDYDFYLDVIDKFLNNKFINNNNKIYLRQTRRNLLKAQKVK
jgi:glycosyltransferase involved in cell wall biosynthesis